MNPVQYILVDKTLNMSPGKLAAQVAHASQLGLLTHRDSDKGRTDPYEDSIVNLWMRGGHYAKIVLECEDLDVAERYLNDRGFETALIIDEGRTEFDGGLTPTAIGTGVVDKDWPHTRQTFGAFKLYGSTAASWPPLPSEIKTMPPSVMYVKPDPSRWARIRSSAQNFLGVNKAPGVAIPATISVDRHEVDPWPCEVDSSYEPCDGARHSCQ